MAYKARRIEIIVLRIGERAKVDMGTSPLNAARIKTTIKQVIQAVVDHPRDHTLQQYAGYALIHFMYTPFMPDAEGAFNPSAYMDDPDVLVVGSLC